MSRRILVLLVAMTCASWAAGAAADPTDHASFDLYAFSQRDNGGDPLRQEAFVNTGGRGEIRVATSKQLAAWANATIAILNNSDPAPVPGTIANATVLSASGTIIYLETSLGVEWTSEDADWILTPGIYYHHQSSIIAGGADFTLQHLMAGGDTTLLASYSFRLGFRKLHYWDGTEEYDHSHPTPSHTILLGWTQTLSPSVRATINAIYARQEGILSNTFAFVTLVDDSQIPRHLVDERLPTQRNRYQLSGRIRWSPQVALALGLDASGYFDDWDVHHLAIEPSAEMEVVEGVRLRAWYRFSAQSATKYFRILPTTIEQFQTQDSDLGSFAMHSPGLEVSAAMSRFADMTWTLKLGVFGFYRSDGIFAIGGHSGVSTSW